MGSGTRTVERESTKESRESALATEKAQPSGLHEEVFNSKEYALASNASKGAVLDLELKPTQQDVDLLAEQLKRGTAETLAERAQEGEQSDLMAAHRPHNHGRVFTPGHHWHPPHGHQWGWHDHARFNRGWDAWFFQQSPNYQIWRQEIAREAQTIGLLLDTGNGALAAQRMQADLIRLRPDRYAQNEFINQVFLRERKGVGSDLVLGRWDPLSGGWTSGFIRQSPFYPGPVYPIYY